MTLLREIRKRAGMTMSELARKSGTLPSMIYGYEHGTLPRAETQARIAAVFGVKPRTIFNGLPKMGRKKGSHNAGPRMRRIHLVTVLCVWCGNGTTKDIRMIGADEDERRYCSVFCLSQYLWTNKKYVG